MGTDEIIDSLATRQHGVVARQQLLAAGLSRHAIDWVTASGRAAALYPGVYLLAGHTPDWPAPLMAACLATGGVASHRAAAHLHGLLDTAYLELTVPLSSRPRLPGVRRADLARADIDRSGAIPRTRVARTLIDLAAVDSALAAEALDTALSGRLVTTDYVRRRLETLGRQGRKGAGALIRLLADGPARAESTFERRLLRLLQDAGLPRPMPQYEVTLGDGRQVRLDFAYPPVLLAIEADSFRHHSSRRDWARDRIRNRELTAMGWRILPATWEDLTPSSPLLGQIRRGLDFRPARAG